LAKSPPPRWFLVMDKKATLDRGDVEAVAGKVVRFAGVGIIRAAYERKDYLEVRVSPLELAISDQTPTERDAPGALELVR
jgi:hypothetical protein